MSSIADPQTRVPPNEHNRELLIALFGALCLFFSTLEYLIPKPLPFFRLGLANLPILLAFPLFSGREIVLLTVLKVLGQALVNGTLASYVFLFSLAGSVASVLVMYLAWHFLRPWISFVGISMLGALASNIVQIALSISFIFGATAWIIAPVFMGLGLGAGLAVGMSAQVFAKRSVWYRGLVEGTPAPLIMDSGSVSPEVPVGKKRRLRFKLDSRWDIAGRFVSPEALFWAGLLVLPAYFFQENLIVRTAQACLFAFFALCAGKRLSFLYFATIIASITFFNVLAPAGKVLFMIGSFPVTEHSLKEGLYKGIGIVGLVMISLATVRGTLKLPGRIGRLLGGLFRYYEAILVNRGLVQIRQLVSSVDRVLFTISGENVGFLDEKTRQSTTMAGWLVLGALVLLQWALLFVRF